MISFPLLQRLDIIGFGMFPGPPEHPTGLHIEFHPGLTLIIGANGLGKSTLVAILFRLLTGPYDISRLDDRAELGTLRIVHKLMPPRDRRLFANRVADGAMGAKARLTFYLGKSEIVVERNLLDLSLSFLSIDGVPQGIDEMTDFQEALLPLAGISSLGDWILMLRHLTFYFEDRRELVWDPTAQRQILRLLYLPADQAKQWTDNEREILSLDSRIRNLNATLVREVQELARQEVDSANVSRTRLTLTKLESDNRADSERHAELSALLSPVESAREGARQKLLEAEHSRESILREYEHAKLMAINSRFPNNNDTARFILTQLMTTDVCLVCGSTATSMAREYETRMNGNNCIVCGMALERPSEIIPAGDVADRRINRLLEQLHSVDVLVATVKEELSKAETEYNATISKLQELSTRLADQEKQINILLASLPASESLIHQQRTELNTIRARVEIMRADLSQKREDFRRFLEQANTTIASNADATKKRFDELASDFLLDSCQLTWYPQRSRLGETGDRLEFPAFQVHLTGTDFPTPVPRFGPDQVSESQREFIDLAFRMALMLVAGNGSPGTLVVDAPESSLDAVFSKRAAKVLAGFASPPNGNRLIITSNLVEGRLIPELVSLASRATPSDPQIVDLLTIAAPTEAVRRFRSEYDSLRERLFHQGSHSYD